MASARKAYSKVRGHEGGFQANPKDTGNYCNGQLIGTNRGVSAVGYNAFFGFCPSVAQLKNLSDEDAYRIYKKQYWDVVQGDKIKNQSVAELIADWAFNSGSGTATKQVQKVLVSMGRKEIWPDGKFGPKTLTATNSVNQPKLHDGIQDARVEFVQNLANANPYNYAWALAGWLKRIYSFEFDGVMGKPKHRIGLLILVLLFALAFIWRSDIKKLAHGS